MRIIFVNLEINAKNIPNGTKYNYVIPSDPEIVGLIGSFNVNGSKNNTTKTEVNTLLNTIKGFVNETIAGIETDVGTYTSTIRTINNYLYNILAKGKGNVYKQLYISSRLAHINNYINSSEVITSLPTQSPMEAYNSLNQSTFDTHEASIIKKVLYLGMHIATAKKSNSGSSPITVGHINTYRNIFRVFNDCIPIIGLNNKFLESIEYKENEKKIIYVPETLGDIFFLENRENYGTIAEANNKKIGVGKNHFITVTGTANISMNNNDTRRWSDRMEYGNNKPLIIEYIVRTTKNAWGQKNNEDS